MNKNQKIANVIENIITPVILFIFSFYDFNKGIDLCDAGFSMAQFAHFDNYPGREIIPTFLSAMFGSILYKLPMGDTWYGLTFYCTWVIALTLIIAYVMCKKILDWKLVAISEIFALFFCWNPNVVLYDYLSFCLFTLGMSLLSTALLYENKSGFYICAGIVLGLNVFVRFPNITHMASIVLLWYCGYIKRWKINEILKKTLLCIVGYIIGVGGTSLVILQKYGWQEFKLAFYYLFNLSQNTDDYSIFFMATQTLMVVLEYAKYVSGLVIVGVLTGIALNKWEDKKRLIVIISFLVIGCYYYIIAKEFGVFTYNWQSFDSILGITCIFLLWGLGCATWLLFFDKKCDVRIYALMYIGIFFVIPLGSNNNIYLEIMNMFLLIPLTFFLSKEVIVESKKCLKLTWGVHGISAMKVVLVGSLMVMALQAIGFGVSYVFNDVPEHRAEKYRYAGVYSSSERIEMLDEMYKYCETEKLIGCEAIMYCHAPGLSYVLDMPTAIDSTWMDWYTYSVEQFVDSMDNLEKEVISGRKLPIIILDIDRHQYYCGEVVEALQNVDAAALDKMWRLNKFMRDYEYQCVYQNGKFAIYRNIG